MKFLAITRAVVGFATSLHLSALKLGISRMEAKVARTVRKTDVARIVYHAALDTIQYADALYLAARKAEQGVKSDLAMFIGAAKAEADALRTDHTVGA